MRIAGRVGPLVAVIAAVVAITGCGTTTGSLLTKGAATQLTAELTQASRALDQYNCQVAYTALTNFRNDVAQLQGVNTTLVRTLTGGAATIDELANDRCPTGASSTTRPDTNTETTTHTSTTVTTATATPSTTTPDTSTNDVSTTSDSGGAAPTTTEPTIPTVPTTPAVTSSAPTATTTDNSGGAGLSGSTGSGGVGVGSGQ